jgi:hypothetical protein
MGGGTAEPDGLAQAHFRAWSRREILSRMAKVGQQEIMAGLRPVGQVPRARLSEFVFAPGEQCANRPPSPLRKKH